MMINFTIPIAPKPSNQRRAALVGGHARIVQDKGVRSHQAIIAAMSAEHRPATVLDEPVSVSIVVVLPRPAYLSRVSKRTGEPLQPPERVPHVSRPDCDNLAKSVLDGMSGWWRDDCIVQRLVVEKWTAAFGEQPHYEVTVCAVEVKSCPP